MKTPEVFLIEGLDRLGKSTLVHNIQNRLGFYQQIHFSKPLVLDVYQTMLEANYTEQQHKQIKQEAYQRASFSNLFELINGDGNIICDRAHLGEYVYAPMYRGYSGEYVFKLETDFNLDYANHIRLILLTQDMDQERDMIATYGKGLFVDDGDSLGPVENREMEQNRFIEAFDMSVIIDKRIICVTDTDGRFKSQAAILEEALRD